MPRMLAHNWQWKLASLVVATALWFAVLGEPEVVTIEAVPLGYRNLPAGFLLVSDPPNSVSVELSGASRQIARGNLSEVKVLLDLGGVRDAGEHLFTVSESEVILPEGVTFVRAAPSQMQLSFDRLATREVPVQIQVKGAQAEGYRVVRREVSPEKVRIPGPSAYVQAVAGALSDAVDISGQTRAVEVAVRASVSDPRVKLEPPALVTVKMTIEKGSGSARE